MFSIVRGLLVLVLALGFAVMVPLRRLGENILPPSRCQPCMRCVRFSLFHGLPRQRHNMENLAKQLRIVGR